MSPSRTGSTGTAPMRERTSDLKSCGRGARASGMADAGDAIQGREEGAPALALCVEDLLAGGGEPVEASPAHAGLFDPLALDEPAALEAIERGIERRDVELQRACGSRIDQLGDFVAM